MDAAHVLPACRRRDDGCGRRAGRGVGDPPAARSGSDAIVMVTIAIAATLGVALMRSRFSLPEWALGAAFATGTVLITLGTYEGGTHSAGTDDNEMFYVWICLLAFNFLSFRHALAQLAFIAVAYTLLLVDAPLTVAVNSLADLGHDAARGGPPRAPPPLETGAARLGALRAGANRRTDRTAEPDLARGAGRAGARARPAPRHAGEPDRRSTWTASRRSTTPAAIRPATSSCAPSPTGFGVRRDRSTLSRDREGTNSPSCSPARPFATPSWSRTASA